MTEFQTALSESIGAIASAQGSAWSFGKSTFPAAASDLKPNDPRLVGASDRLMELRVSIPDLPTPPPKRGNELTRAGLFYRVVKTERNDASQIATILVSVS